MTAASENIPTVGRPRFALMILLTALFAGLLIIYEREQLADRHHQQQLRLETVQELVKVRENIQSTIFDRILEMRELTTIISRNPRISDAAFGRSVAGYLRDNPEVLNIALAPDLIVTSVFPKEGNERVIGLDYRSNQEQFPKVKQALEIGHGLVTGPVNLIQGGQGLILRQPVYYQSESVSEEPKKSWGILSMVIDYDHFLQGLGITELEGNLDLLIREVGVESYEQQTFFGMDDLAEKDPAKVLFEFSFGNWELAATTKGGWPSHRPNFIWSVTSELIVLAFILATILYVTRLIEARRKSQEQLTNSIEALPDAFVMFDPDGKLQMYNSKFRDLHGEISPLLKIGLHYEEIIKLGLKKGIFKDAFEREDEWLQEWREMRKLPSFSRQMSHSDGRVLLVSDSVMADGSTVGLRIDVTELQDARIAAEAANRAKSDFMAVLSHELRTPLTIILGMARLSGNLNKLPSAKALSEAFADLPEAKQADLTDKTTVVYDTIAKMMEKIEHSGNHLLFLVNEILDFAKMEASGLVLNEEEADIAEIIAISADQIRPMAEQKELLIETEAQPLVLNVDRKRVQQVLLNLLGNAVKFTPSGKISVTVEQNRTQFLIKVTDTGLGMPEGEVEKVFEPFHQVDTSNKRGIGGTGLGLAISREIAEAHGGTLTAKTIEGQGSTFTLALPLPTAQLSVLPTPVEKVVSAA